MVMVQLNWYIHNYSLMFFIFSEEKKNNKFVKITIYKLYYYFNLIINLAVGMAN